jgi:hypothetical protein
MLKVSSEKGDAMHAIHLTHHFPFVEAFDVDVAPQSEAATATKTEEAHFAAIIDLPMLGAWTAILVYMALFAGFLYSWFTMGG